MADNDVAGTPITKKDWSARLGTQGNKKIHVNLFVLS